MAGVQPIFSSKESRRFTGPAPFNYETYYQHHEKEPSHSNALLQYVAETELKYRNDNLYEEEIDRLPRRSDIINRYITMNPNFEHLNRVYEPNLTTIEKQRYKRCVEQQKQKIHRIQKKFDFQTVDGHSSHYFLTGARYNRFDTVDSKILLKYGTFVNRNNPEQVEIKASHFKKFREILQAQQRSSSGPGMESSRRDAHDYNNFMADKNQQEDLDDLTSRYDRHSSRQSNLKAQNVNSRTRLPKLKDPARYIDVASQMPEKRRARRSMDRAASSSSTHRSTRHRRHSQHQQQSSPAQQTSVSYVANKVSFSLVDESKPPVTTLVSAYNTLEDEYDVPTGPNEHHHQNLDTRESIDDDENNQQTETKHDHNDDDDDDEDIETDDNEEDQVLVEQLREHANLVITNILASAMSQMNSTIIE